MVLGDSAEACWILGTEDCCSLADDDSTTIRAAAADGAAAIPFTIDQLYEAIRTGMAALSDPRFAADEVIPHLSVRDRVFLGAGCRSIVRSSTMVIPGLGCPRLRSKMFNGRHADVFAIIRMFVWQLGTVS